MKALQDIYKNRTVPKVIMAIGIVAFMIFFFCAWCIYDHPCHCDRTSSFILGALWTVGTPTWFFIEHFYLFKRYGDPAQYEQFKRAQELASKIWLASIAVLAAAWTGGFPK